MQISSVLMHKGPFTHFSSEQAWSLVNARSCKMLDSAQSLAQLHVILHAAGVHDGKQTSPSPSSLLTHEPAQTSLPCSRCLSWRATSPISPTHVCLLHMQAFCGMQKLLFLKLRCHLCQPKLTLHAPTFLHRTTSSVCG